MSPALARVARPRAAPSRAEAIAAHRAGRIAVAAGACDALLAESPDDHELLHLRGVIDGESGDPVRASRRLRRAIALDPGIARYHVDLAGALQAIGRLDEAEEAALRGVALDASAPAAWAALGAVRAARGDADSAANAFARAIELDPDHAQANASLGALLRARGRVDEARVCFRAALRANPYSAAAANDLGTTFAAAGEHDAAEAWFAAAASLDPAFLEPLLHLAEARERLGDDAAAIGHLRRALLVAPDSVRARWRLAGLLLRSGALAEGWALREQGIGIAGFRGPARPFRMRRSRGPARRALLWGEGDPAAEILFASLVPDALAPGAEGVIECDPRLVALFQRSFPRLTAVARRDRPDPATAAGAFDLALPVASLGAALRPDFSAFPARRGFLRADPRRAAALRARHSPDGSRLVGLAAGDGPAAGWATLLRLPACRFVALDAAAARLPGVVADAEIELGADLDSRAAQIAAMDDVLAVDGVAAHLAGALGAPAAVLLPAAGADWCWFTGRAGSPWYPSLAVLRGSTAAVSDDTIAAAARRLAAPPAAEPLRSVA